MAYNKKRSIKTSFLVTVSKKIINMKNNIVVFYVKGIHPLDEYIEKISFEELRIKDNMSAAEINEIIKDYYENVFLEEVP